jgi:nucleotide-binding universal stress UspA family protein
MTHKELPAAGRAGARLAPAGGSAGLRCSADEGGRGAADGGNAMAAGVGPVLVGTDFSDTAGTALAEARRLAELLHTHVEIVHVEDGPAGAGGADSEPAVRWLTAAGLEAGMITVRSGCAWVELARYASEAAPMLVVVGSHGQSGYQPLALGSTASRVSLHARCPVVVVSPRAAQLAFDGGTHENREDAAGRAGAAAVARQDRAVHNEEDAR